MASISKPLGTDKNGKKIYMVSWREPGGKQRHKRVHGLEEAKKFKAEIELALATGQYKSFSDMTLEQYILKWVQEQKETKRYKTFEDYELIAVKHIVPHLGKIKLKELKPFHVKEYLINKLREGRLDKKPGGLSTETVTKHRRILHLILQCAYEDELVQENVVNRVNIRKIITPSQEVKKREKIALTRDQVIELLKLAEDTPLYLPILIAVCTGLRRGEVLGLKWENVDLKNRIIYVRKTLQRQKKEVPDGVPGPKTELKLDSRAKSKYSKAKPVVIPKILATQLAKEKKAQAARKLQWGPAYEDHGLVCCQANGKPWDPSDFSHKFREFIDTKTSLPKICFHDLRHTFITIMAEELRIGLNTVADLARHSDPGFTARTYIHPNMHLYYEAIDMFEAYITGGQKENQLSEAGQR